MENVIVILIVALIFFFAARYCYKAKKSGRRCIGCSNSGGCGSDESACCGCGCGGTKEK